MALLQAESKRLRPLTRPAVVVARALTSGKLEAGPAKSDLVANAKYQAFECAAEPTTVSQDLARQAAEALKAPGQASLWGEWRRAALMVLTPAPRPHEIEVRAELMHMAGEHAREVNGREPEAKVAQTLPPRPPQPEGPTGGLIGFQRLEIRAAALEARKAK